MQGRITNQKIPRSITRGVRDRKPVMLHFLVGDRVQLGSDEVLHNRANKHGSSDFALPCSRLSK